MKSIHSVQFHAGSKEELLPDFASDFPYIASYVELDKFHRRFSPWHWHKAVELFYIKSGTLEYDTPKGRTVFPAGSGGLVNSNVLHMTKTDSEEGKCEQLIHIFEPSFIAGLQGSRIEQKYVTPIVTAPQIELIALYPEDPKQAGILQAIQESFQLSENAFGYEVKLRSCLSDIWMQIFETILPVLEKSDGSDRLGDKVKTMLVYIHEHYAEKLTIAEIAAAAYSSERECYRGFHDCLHMTPVEYIKNYRLQMACQMLAKGNDTITAVGHACGLGSSSYFGKIFREYFDCTPAEYRRRWQDSDR